MKNLLKTLIFSILFISSQAQALETDWQDSSVKKEGSISLVSAGYTDSNKIISGIHIKLSGNWKAYWKHPGDSGMPISPDFSLSENIKSSEVLWPVPSRHLFYDVEGWGYGGEIILPVIFEVIDPSKPVKLNVRVKWALCNENCIFMDNKLTLEIPTGYKSTEYMQLIEKFRKEVPKKISEGSEVKLEKLVVSDKSIQAEFSSVQKFSDDVDLFIYEDSKNFRYPKPEITISPDGKKIVVKTNYEVLKKGDNLVRKTLKLTLKNGDNSYETEFKVSKLEPSKSEPSKSEPSKSENHEVNSEGSTITYLKAIIAAILGGLILNIMPCVLPVLLLKIFGVIKHGSRDKKYIKKSFSYTIAGIIFSFMVLAVFVVTLKALGHEVGWGIQFQHPPFLVFLSIMLTLFAANQWGVFEIALPHKLSDKINYKIDMAGDSTPVGNFLTGAFATLLATPCTAPFLTTAVTFAFTANYLTIFLIFFFMGIGLSLPYVLIMVSPSLARFFPKPGRWINVIKFILGIFLFLTNFWIFYILFNNGGVNSAFMLFVCIVFTLIWLVVAKKLKLDKVRTLYTVLWMIVATFFVVLRLAAVEKEPEFMKGVWVKFDKSEITKYVAEGKIVFVDVTADWCINCQFNKANVVYPMKNYFDNEGVILMKADYTAPSEIIYNYMVENNSYGIPLDIIYGPNAVSGIKLPVILKEQDIREAIEKAK